MKHSFNAHSVDPKILVQLACKQSFFHILHSCQQPALYLQSFITVLYIVCSDCGYTEDHHSGFIGKCFFSSTNCEEKSCVQVSITWMLNSECLCNLSAAITDCIAFLVTAVADRFLHPFVETLLLRYSGCGSHFKGLFCFSWANLCLIFLAVQHCNRKKQLPPRKISDID